MLYLTLISILSPGSPGLGQGKANQTPEPRRPAPGLRMILLGRVAVMKKV